MLTLRQAQVFKYKSINDSGPVALSDSVTVLVGQNESGKTAFLEAMDKALSAEGHMFSIVSDYPRKELTQYQKRHEKKPDTVARLEFEADAETVEEINRDVFGGVPVLSAPLCFTYLKKYDNGATIELPSVTDKSFIDHYSLAFSDIEKAGHAFAQGSVREVLSKLEAAEVDPESKIGAFLKKWTEALGTKQEPWLSEIGRYVWEKHLSPALPRFAYFDDYKLLPAKVNLQTLQQRVSQKTLLPEDEAVLGLLNLAGIDLDELIRSDGYESGRAQLEAISNKITDEIFEYWTQNKQLEVVFDIDDDPKEQPPFNAGKNLYVRIRNQRHRVTVPFDQRSKGFIWFFSFLVWFQSVQERVGTNHDLVLLLDEPGLNLHALAQQDLLRYIDRLSENHQIIFTTHSPFMVDSGRLNSVRVVEDKDVVGTVLTEELQGSTQKSLFPLQAALGYTIAQNLFIGTKNLLIEGPADLLYIQFMSRILEESGRRPLDGAVTLVPTGGLDKIATFIVLLGANDLSVAVLHDFKGRPEQRLDDLVKQRLLDARRLMHFAEFRPGAGKNFVATDIEDLLPVPVYLRAFNQAYSKELAGAEITQSDLPPGDRIIDRINRYAAEKGITFKKDGDFNHYRVANVFISLGLDGALLGNETMASFESLFAKVNGALS